MQMQEESFLFRWPFGFGCICTIFFFTSIYLPLCLRRALTLNSRTQKLQRHKWKFFKERNCKHKRALPLPVPQPEVLIQVQKQCVSQGWYRGWTHKRLWELWSFLEAFRAQDKARKFPKAVGGGGLWSSLLGNIQGQLWAIWGWHHLSWTLFSLGCFPLTHPSKWNLTYLFSFLQEFLGCKWTLASITEPPWEDLI
jgi:hypothetical protein